MSESGSQKQAAKVATLCRIAQSIPVEFYAQIKACTITVE